MHLFLAQWTIGADEITLHPELCLPWTYMVLAARKWISLTRTKPQNIFMGGWLVKITRAYD